MLSISFLDMSLFLLVIWQSFEKHVSVLVPFKKYRKWYKQNGKSPAAELWQVLEQEKEQLADASIVIVHLGWKESEDGRGTKEIKALVKSIGWCWPPVRDVPFEPGYNFLETPSSAKRICQAKGRKP